MSGPPGWLLANVKRSSQTEERRQPVDHAASSAAERSDSTAFRLFGTRNATTQRQQLAKRMSAAAF